MTPSYSKNHYKKFLIDEIQRCSNHDLSKAIEEVRAFSTTEDFEKTFKKWRFLQWEKDKHSPKNFKLKSIKEILEACKPKKNAKKYSVV